MSRVIYVRVTPDEHAAIRAAAHAARADSLQQFCQLAIQDAVDRWQPTTPIAAEAACAEPGPCLDDLRT